MTNKIWKVRPYTPDIGHIWKNVDEQVKYYANINSHVDVYHLHRETEKCFYVTSREDDSKPYRQLKEDAAWFHTEVEALQHLSEQIAGHHQRLMLFAKASEGMMLKISELQDAIAEGQP